MDRPYPDMPVSTGGHGYASYRDTGWDALLAPRAAPLWAVIDGVNCRDVAQRVQGDMVQSTCLYTSTDADTRAMAPWLVRVDPDGPVARWLADLAQDQHWGVLVQSEASIHQLRMHLRKFTMLWTPANEESPVYFRFYDPRVAVDMVDAIEPWKLDRFFAKIGRLIAPMSAQVLLPTGADLAQPPALDATEESYRGRLVAITPTEPPRDDGGASRSFRIGQPEFARFGALQKRRSQLKMAQELLVPFPECTPGETLEAVEAAGDLGARHAMTSVRQVHTLARCFLEFGMGFPQGYRDAAHILDDTQSAPWRKSKLLEAWIPRGRVRRDMLTRLEDEEESFEAVIQSNRTARAAQ